MLANMKNDLAENGSRQLKKTSPKQRLILQILTSHIYLSVMLLGSIMYNYLSILIKNNELI